MTGDDAMRAYAGDLPAPDMGEPPFTTPPPLHEATVAIVTTAALHAPDDDAFGQGDTTFRTIDRHQRDLVLGHWSPNFDRTGFYADIDVVYPIDRLEELAADGTIAAVAPRHIAFAGNQPDTVSEIRLDTGPAAAAALRHDGVDVVLLTPV
jgi:hypothetical protein